MANGATTVAHNSTMRNIQARRQWSVCVKRQAHVLEASGCLERRRPLTHLGYLRITVVQKLSREDLPRAPHLCCLVDQRRSTRSWKTPPFPLSVAPCSLAGLLQCYADLRLNWSLVRPAGRHAKVCLLARSPYIPCPRHRYAFSARLPVHETHCVLSYPARDGKVGTMSVDGLNPKQLASSRPPGLPPVSAYHSSSPTRAQLSSTKWPSGHGEAELVVLPQFAFSPLGSLRLGRNQP